MAEIREKYVTLVKEYINSLPEYKHAIDEIREELRRIGTTDDEFELALQQITEEENQKPTPKVEKKTHLFKRLIEIDIVTHMAVMVLVLGIAVLYVLIPFLSQRKSLSDTETNPNIIHQLANSSKNLINTHVYAKTQVLDAERIFSFPATNVTLAINSNPKKEVYGFFPYWMLDVQDKISLNGVTNIGLFGLEVDGKGNIVVADQEGNVDGGWAMWNDPKLQNLLQRAKSRRVSTELVIKAFNNTNIESLVLSDSAQKTFISNAVQLVQLKNLNGINLDFEYVGDPDPKVRTAFTRFVTNLRTELKRQTLNSSLTICTYIHSASNPKLFEVEELTPYIDAFIIMGYDFHTPNGDPGPIAPMEGALGIIGSLQSYLEKVPAEKLILAVPYYGYDWDISANGENKTIPYAELAAITKGKTIDWDDITQTPMYRYIDSETSASRIVHFENPRSLGIKFDYINRKNLKGIGIWALGYDGLNADLRQVILEKFAY